MQYGQNKIESEEAGLENSKSSDTNKPNNEVNKKLPK